MPAPRAGFIMFLLMFEIGRRRRRFPILKVKEVVNAAIAIGARLLWKLPAIVERASDGSLTISPRLISPAPVSCIVFSPEKGFEVVGIADIPRSALPVMKPTGEVPATPSVNIVA